MRDRLGKDSHQRASSRSDRVWEHTVQGLGILAEHIDKLGKNIQKSVQLYNGVASSLEKRFLVQARQITALADSSDRKLTVTALESEKAIVRPFSSPELTSTDVPESN